MIWCVKAAALVIGLWKHAVKNFQERIFIRSAKREAGRHGARSGAKKSPLPAKALRTLTARRLRKDKLSLNHNRRPVQQLRPDIIALKHKKVNL